MSKPSAALDVYNPTKVLNSALSILGPNPSSLLGEDTILDRDLTSDEKLFTLLCNYLSLSQFELARPIITELFFACPDRITTLLRSMIIKHIPEQWLLSDVLPTVGHLQWLALVEYAQLYSNVFDKPVSITPTVPLVTCSKDSRFLTLGQSDLVASQKINPLGFITHDQLVVQVIEVNLRKSTGSQLMSEISLVDGNSKTKVVLQGTDSTSSSSLYMNQNICTPSAPTDLSPVGRAEYNPPYKQKLHIDLLDSKVIIYVSTITLYIPGTHVNTNNKYISIKDNNVITVVGKAIVDLSLLRGKDKYHIWVPLLSPDSEDVINAEKQVGRIRIRLRWKQIDLLPRRDGSMRVVSDKVCFGLETDLLLAHVSLHCPEINPSTNQVLKESILNIDQITELRQYMMYSIHEDISKKLASTNSGYQPTLRIIHSLSALRKLIRLYPTVGHNLCAHLCAVRPQDPTWTYLYAELIFEMLLRQEYPAAIQAVTVLVQDIYPGDEFYTALSGVAITVSDQVSGPRAMIREVFRTLVHYIHDDKHARQYLLRLLSHKRLVTGLSGLDAMDHPNAVHKKNELLSKDMHTIFANQRDVLSRKSKIYGAFIGNAQLLRQFCALEDYYLYGELQSFLNTDVDTSDSNIPYNSNNLLSLLLNNEVVLHQTGLRQPNPNEGPLTPITGMPKDNVSYSIPLFFKTFYDATKETDLAQQEACTSFGVPANRLPQHIQEPLFTQREDIYSSFWSDYYSFVRACNLNIYEYPIKAVLEYVNIITSIYNSTSWHSKGYSCLPNTPGALTPVEKEALLNVLWSCIAYITAPFNNLRPMILITAWDQVKSQDTFELRKLLLKYIWEPYTSVLSTYTSILPLSQISADINSKSGDNGTGSSTSTNDAILAHDNNSATMYKATDKTSWSKLLHVYQCSEPRLVSQCNRFQFYITLIELMFTRVSKLQNLDATQKESLYKTLFHQMNTSSPVQVIHPYLSELEPSVMINCLKTQIENELNCGYINSKEQENKKVSMEYAEKLASWTPEQRAFFSATGITPDGQLFDPFIVSGILNQDFTNSLRNTIVVGPKTNIPEANTAELLQAQGDLSRIDDGILRNPLDTRVSITEALVTDLTHDLHVLCSYYAISCFLRIIQLQIQSRHVSNSEREELFVLCRGFISAMHYRSFQIANFEKLYALLFVTISDLKSSVGMYKDIYNEPITLPPEEENEEDLLDFDILLAHHKSGKSSSNSPGGKPKVQRYVFKGAALQQTLDFLYDCVNNLRLLVSSDSVESVQYKENHMLQERLYQLHSQLVEAKWRSNILATLLSNDSLKTKKISHNFSMLHVCAPLHYLSSYLMYKQRRNENVMLFPLPVLPQAIVTHAKSADAAIYESSKNMLNLFISSVEASNGTDNNSSTDKTNGSTEIPEYMQKLAQMLTGVYDSFSSQVSHAMNIAKDAKLWSQCTDFVESRLTDLIDATIKYHWADDGTRTEQEKIADYTEAIIARKGERILHGHAAKTMNDIEIAGDTSIGVDKSGKKTQTSASAIYTSNSPHRFAADVVQFIEQHLTVATSSASSASASSTSTTSTKYSTRGRDEVLEIVYLVATDLAICYSDRLPRPHYLALLNSALEYIVLLKNLCETVLFTYMSERSISSLTATLHVSSSVTKDVIKTIIESQDRIRASLQTRINICDTLIEFTRARQLDVDGIAISLIPASILGVENTQDVVTENSYLRAWRRFAQEVHLREQELLPECPWTSQNALAVMRSIVNTILKENILHKKKEIQENMASVQNHTNVDLYGDASMKNKTVTEAKSLNLDDYKHIGAKGYVDACSYVISNTTQNMLSRAMLPPLVAVKIGLKSAILHSFDTIKKTHGLPGAAMGYKDTATLLDEAIAIALHYSRGLPVVRSWILWRVNAYRKVAQYIEFIQNMTFYILEYNKPSTSPANTNDPENNTTTSTTTTLSASTSSIISNRRGSAGSSLQITPYRITYYPPQLQHDESLASSLPYIDLLELRVKIDTWLDLLAKESAYRDQMVYHNIFIEYLRLITLCEQHSEYLYNTITSYKQAYNITNDNPQHSEVLTNHRRQTTAVRLVNLELIDTSLDDTILRNRITEEILDTKLSQITRLRYVDDLITRKQNLIHDIIVDLTEPNDQPLRVQLLMRIDNPVEYASLVLRYASRWTDNTSLLALTYRGIIVLSTYILSTKQLTKDVIAMQQKLARIYQVLGIYSRIESDAKKNTEQMNLSVHANNTGSSDRLDKNNMIPISSLTLASFYTLYPDWCRFEQALQNDLENVIETLLTWRLYGLALKAYYIFMLPIISPEYIYNIEVITDMCGQNINDVTLPSHINVRNRWYYGQQQEPLRLTDACNDMLLPSSIASTSATRIGIHDTSSTITSPLSTYCTWMSVMSAEEAKLRQCPAGFESHDQAMQLRIALKLESASIILLLYQNNSSRAHLRGIKRITELFTMIPSFSLSQTYQICKDVVNYVDNFHAKMLVMEILHEKFVTTKMNINITSEQYVVSKANMIYPSLSTTEATWMINTMIGLQILSALPSYLRSQVLSLNLFTLDTPELNTSQDFADTTNTTSTNPDGSTGTSSATDSTTNSSSPHQVPSSKQPSRTVLPLDIVHSLYVLGHSRLVTVLFKKFRHGFDLQKLIDHITRVFTHTYTNTLNINASMDTNVTTLDLKLANLAKIVNKTEEEQKQYTQLLVDKEALQNSNPSPYLYISDTPKDIEICLLFLDLILQFSLSPEDFLLIGSCVLRLIRHLVDDETSKIGTTSRVFTNKMLALKLFKYYDNYCATHVQSPLLISQYTYLYNLVTELRVHEVSETMLPSSSLSINVNTSPPMTLSTPASDLDLGEDLSNTIRDATLEPLSIIPNYDEQDGFGTAGLTDPLHRDENDEYYDEDEYEYEDEDYDEDEEQYA